MKQTLSSVFLAGALVLLAAGLTWAEQAYVSNLQITVRRGAGIEYKITSFLKSGTEAELLSDEAGWAHIRFGEGKAGYVLSRFLTDDPPLGHRAEKVRGRYESLQQALTELQTTNQALHREGDWLVRLRAGEELTPETDDGSASAAELTGSIELARQILAEESSRLTDLRDRIAFEEDRVTWFLFGSSAAGLGMGLGFLSGALRRRK
ncbi:MAG: TIGR04211 family SH3 domain-containing protein [Deltaproteobacteria bacterium]|nr:TIGR04211 family SH3 domain-containing protein [Deltaproteobacteria bacterium]